MSDHAIPLQMQHDERRYLQQEQTQGDGVSSLKNCGVERGSRRQGLSATDHLYPIIAKVVTSYESGAGDRI